MEDVTLHVDELTKAYGRHVAVDAVSFTVGPGDIAGLLGPNGSGKSSILHCLTGVVTPTSGRIVLAGRDHRSAAAKAALGFAPDDLPLPMNLTGVEYLDLVRRLQPAYDPALARELAELLGLAPDLPQLICEYSHGMKRKIQTIAALAHRPRLLVLDEPFRGLDPAAHVVLRGLVREFTAAGGAVLMATHDMSAAQVYCDTVTVVADGVVVADGRPHELLDAYGHASLEEVFLEATGLAGHTAGLDGRLAGLRLAPGGERRGVGAAGGGRS